MRTHSGDARPPRGARSRARSRSGSSVAGEAEYPFKHVLTRDVAYETLPRRDRARRARIRGPLDRGFGGDGSGEFGELLAHHFAEAYEAERGTGQRDPERAEELRRRAFEALVAAAAEARRRSAVEAPSVSRSRARRSRPTRSSAPTRSRLEARPPSPTTAATSRGPPSAKRPISVSSTPATTTSRSPMRAPAPSSRRRGGRGP